jgi:hypothetical protein
MASSEFESTARQIRVEDEKGYFLRSEDRGDHLWVLVGGDRLTADIAKAYWDEIAAKCSVSQCNKILIEKDFRLPVRPEEMVQMAEHVAAVLPNSCIAFIDRWHHDGINELGKRLARNQNIKMQTFKTADEAAKWLRAN